MSLTTLSNDLAAIGGNDASVIRKTIGESVAKLMLDSYKAKVEGKKGASKDGPKKPRGPKIVYEAKVTKPTLVCQIFDDKNKAASYLLFASDEQLKKVSTEINDSSKSKILAQNKAKTDVETYGFYLKLRSSKNLPAVKKYFEKKKYAVFDNWAKFEGEDAEEPEDEDESEAESEEPEEDAGSDEEDSE